jgi:hypothetical protein
VIQGWFRLVDNIKAKYSILDEDTYNFDEFGFMMGVILTGAVVTGSERQGRPKIMQLGDREWTSIIEGINATEWLSHPSSSSLASTTSLPSTKSQKKADTAGENLTVSTGVRPTTLKEFSARSDGKSTKKRGCTETSTQPLRCCGTCGQTMHNARICKKDVQGTVD